MDLFRHPLATFLAALRFLTILPISWKSEKDSRFFKASLFWFPLVGLCIGAVVSLVLFLGNESIPQAVMPLLTIFLLALVSGFLHLDGVADSGDGLLSSRPRQQALAIMRDSRSGAMGVICLIFLILGKYCVLDNLSFTNLVSAAFCMPIGGRVAILLSMTILPYARKGEGLGRLFYSKQNYCVSLAGLFLFMLSLAFIYLPALWFVTISLLLTVALFSFWCFKKLGGATGDTLGAVCELSEFSVAFGFLIMQNHG